MADVERVVDYGTRFQTLRRIYLKNRKLSSQGERFAESSVWQAHQEEQPGTPLPGDFPALTTLTVGGYTTVEDLDGADATELAEWARISAPQAKAIFAALAAL